MSIVAIPPRKFVDINKKPLNKRVYTIHNETHNPFMIRKTNNDTDESSIESTVISFKREIDAVHFAQMIESHKDITEQWPITTFDNMNSLFVMANIEYSPYYPVQLYLKSWEISELNVYCASNILQLFIMHTITLKEENIYSIKGEHLTFTIPTEKYSEFFEQMFQRNQRKDINDEW